MEQAPIVDVQKFLNQHPFSGFQWRIFGLCFMIVLLDGFDTAAIGYIAPSLIREWNVARPALGPVLSAALFGLAFGALGAGPLSDQLGRRLLLIGSVFLFAVACLASAFSATLEQLTILRFFTGLGLGAAMPNAVTMMSEYCPDGRRATLTNLARNVDQSNVLRLSTRRRFWGLFGGVDDPAIRLAKRTDAGWYRPLSVGGVDAEDAAGVGALHGGQSPAGGEDPGRAQPRVGCRCERGIICHDRACVALGDKERRLRPRAFPTVHHRVGDAVAGVLYGIGRLLRAGELDADPAEGRGY